MQTHEIADHEIQNIIASNLLLHVYADIIWGSGFSTGDIIKTKDGQNFVTTGRLKWRDRDEIERRWDEICEGDRYQAVSVHAHGMTLKNLLLGKFFRQLSCKERDVETLYCNQKKICFLLGAWVSLEFAYVEIKNK